MASTYTTNLGIEKIGTGEQSGTWGDTTNTNLDLIDEAVNGIISITLSSAGSSGSPNSLPITDGASSNGRNKFIEFVDGGDLGGTAYVQLTPNDAEKIVHIRNSLSSSRSIIVFQGTYNASNDFEIVNGADVLLKFNGGGSGATVTDVNVDLTVTGATIATADINGGAIDGTTIGGSTAAAGTFTTFTSNGIDDNADAVAITIDSSENVGIGTTSPSTSLDVVRAGVQPLRLQNTSGTESAINMVNTGGNVQLEAHSGNFNIDADNVGIGTTSPADELHVNAASANVNLRLTRDTNTGARISGSDGASTPVIKFDTIASGTATERMRIASSGVVGIGTSSPVGILHLQSDDNGVVFQSSSSTNSRAQIFFQNNGGTQTAKIAVDPDGGNANVMAFSTSTTERMRIDSSGQVIILGNGGSTVNSLDLSYSGVSGEAKIQADSSGGDTFLTLGTSASGTVAERMRITSSGRVGIGTTSPEVLTHLKSADNTVFQLESTDATVYMKMVDSNTTGAGYIGYVTNDMTFWANNAERMRIDSSGHLGLGTATPSSYSFDTGPALVIGSGSNNPHLSVLSSTSGTGYLSFADGTTGNQMYRGLIEYAHSTDHMGLRTAGNERMRINSSGNVGIGTTSPQYELSFGTGYFGLNYSTGKLSLYQANDTSHSTAVESIGNVEISSSITGSGSGAIIFDTFGSERARIDTSGNLLVGKTSASGSTLGSELRPDGRLIGVATDHEVLFINRKGSDGTIVDIRNDNSVAGTISVSGTTTAYNTSSDERLKENIIDAPAGNIDAIRVRSFDWKADGLHQTYGMVAQELVDVAPEAVTQGETDDDMWQVDYSKLVPMMIKEIQDLKAEVAALKGA